MRSRLLTHFFQMGMGMCVLIDPAMSNCADITLIITSTSTQGQMRDVYDVDFTRCRVECWIVWRGEEGRGEEV